MDLKKMDDGCFGLSLTADELNVLFACLRESFATLGRESYQTRIGVTMDVGSALGDELMHLMEREGIEQ
ncbi:hypothetical protein ORG27_04205 [Stenotrophomonas lactitubi]|jgi:hypothetical protein|uniref:hypothetical protein n=1 Tax=Stenotrophomonas lactitubi TaxID=2045214 RepID=UPI000FA32E8C|nr:hypothetical protein [Stenotrophomonas lactitubi]MCX2892778.1 hypothetical protein [Stenotrophomonas lactitubi]